MKITRQSPRLYERSSDGTDRAISSNSLLHRSRRSCDETKWWNDNAMSNSCVLLPGCLYRLGYDMRVTLQSCFTLLPFEKSKETSQSLLQHSNVSVLSAAPTWCGGDKKCHRGSPCTRCPLVAVQMSRRGHRDADAPRLAQSTRGTLQMADRIRAK